MSSAAWRSFPAEHRGESQLVRAIEPLSYRHDPIVPAFPDDRPIIIFDGKCRLCSAWVRFVLRHDKHDRFRFTTAQSPLGTPSTATTRSIPSTMKQTSCWSADVPG